MCNPIFAMVTGTKDPDKYESVDATRIKRYTAYYIRKNRSKPLLTFVKNAKVPIEHFFNDHTWCDSLWYWSKKIEDKKNRVSLIEEKGMTVYLTNLNTLEKII